MKNSLPLIAAVVLGLAAIFAVSKVLSDKEVAGRENTIAIVVATHDLMTMQEIREGDLTYREVPVTAAPKNGLRWDEVSIAYGQRLPRAIDEDDFLLVTDIRMKATLAECVRDGEWAVPVTFANATLLPMLVPDDEIAILATWQDQKALDDMGEPTTQTTLLMPCVRVLGIVGGNGQFREPQTGGSSTILVSLPPHQAEILIAAQQQASLFPVMRKRNDRTARSRKDGGVVDASTFRKLRENLTAVEMPEVPLK